MSLYYAENALLPDGWAYDVLIETDGAGDIVAVTSGAAFTISNAPCRMSRSESNSGVGPPFLASTS